MGNAAPEGYVTEDEEEEEEGRVDEGGRVKEETRLAYSKFVHSTGRANNEAFFELISKLGELKDDPDRVIMYRDRLCTHLRDCLDREDDFFISHIPWMMRILQKNTNVNVLTYDIIKLSLDVQLRFPQSAFIFDNIMETRFVDYSHINRDDDTREFICHGFSFLEDHLLDPGVYYPPRIARRSLLRRVTTLVQEIAHRMMNAVYLRLVMEAHMYNEFLHLLGFEYTRKIKTGLELEEVFENLLRDRSKAKDSVKYLHEETDALLGGLVGDDMYDRVRIYGSYLMDKLREGERGRAILFMEYLCLYHKEEFEVMVHLTKRAWDNVVFVASTVVRENGVRLKKELAQKIMQALPTG